MPRGADSKRNKQMANLTDPEPWNSKWNHGNAYTGVWTAKLRFRTGELSEGLKALYDINLDQPPPGYPDGAQERLRQKLAAAHTGISRRDPVLLSETAMFNGEGAIPMRRPPEGAARIDLAAEWDKAIAEAVKWLRRRDVNSNELGGIND